MSLLTAPARQTDFHSWNARNFAKGEAEDVLLDTEANRPALTLRPGNRAGSWTSPWYRPGFPIERLVGCWQAETPPGTWIETLVQMQFADERLSSPYHLGSWASENSRTFERRSHSKSDPDGSVDIDQFFARQDRRPVAYRLIVRLHGIGESSPRVYQLAGATAFNLDVMPDFGRSTMTRTIDLGDPNSGFPNVIKPYSQMTHVGEYPAYGGGGEVWCSATSTAMVLDYWGAGPTAAELAALSHDPAFDPGDPGDPQVVWTVFHTWDKRYIGGNWPFNTAVGGARGLDSSVRFCAHPVELEYWIQRGIPPVISLSYRKGQLEGAHAPESGGHLVVVGGVEKSNVVDGIEQGGNFIVYDPAAPTNDLVRTVYNRAQLLECWFRSGGVYYLNKQPWLVG